MVEVFVATRVLPSLIHYTSVPTEPLSALRANELGHAERLVQFVLGSDAVAADAAAKPCCERFLIGEAGGIHRPNLRREQVRVAATDPEDNERPRIPYHRRSHRMRELPVRSPAPFPLVGRALHSSWSRRVYACAPVAPVKVGGMPPRRGRLDGSGNRRARM